MIDYYVQRESKDKIYMGLSLNWMILLSGWKVMIWSKNSTMNMLWIILTRLLPLLRCESYSFIASIFEFMIFYLGYHYMLNSMFKEVIIREITFVKFGSNWI